MVAPILAVLPFIIEIVPALIAVLLEIVACLLAVVGALIPRVVTAVHALVPLLVAILGTLAPVWPLLGTRWTFASTRTISNPSAVSQPSADCAADRTTCDPTRNPARSGAEEIAALAGELTGFGTGPIRNASSRSGFGGKLRGPASVPGTGPIHAAGTVGDAGTGLGGKLRRFSARANTRTIGNASAGFGGKLRRTIRSARAIGRGKL